jgi:hypothetical protein
MISATSLRPLWLGTLFDWRGPVAGIGIAFILTGQFFNGMLPAWLVMRTPLAPR